MRTICCIPIKCDSKRVPSKNFRPFKGRPLFEHILETVKAADCFDAIWVDTDSAEVSSVAAMMGLRVMDRDARLAEDWANGNDLLCDHAERLPDFDLYCQAFATAPTLKPQTIRRCVEVIRDMPEHDSVLTATREPGWYWFNDQPINFRPGILPRSQDAPDLLKETTGFYAVRRDALLRFRSRVGASPYFMLVDPAEAVDLDTEADFRHAENRR